MKDCNTIDLAYLGRIVKDFTSCEMAFNRVGTAVDKVISCDDHDSSVEAMSSLYLLVSTLRVGTDEFYNTLIEYFRENEKGDQSC